MRTSRSASKIERRAELLASKLTQRVNILTDALGGPNQRPPFTQQLSQRQALDWWSTHYNDELGKKWRGMMSTESQMELDQALSQAKEADMMDESGYE